MEGRPPCRPARTQPWSAHRQICGPDGAGPSIYDQEDGVILDSPNSIDDGSEILRSAKYAFFQKQRSLGFRRVLRIVGDQYERRFRFGAKLQEQLDDGVARMLIQI